MIDQIISEQNKITKDVFIIDILIEHIINQELNDKWKFTLQTYQNLKNEIALYQNKEQINEYYIINDYETLKQLLNEFKEDIYNLFPHNLFFLIDGLNNESLEQLSQFQKQVKSNYSSFNNYIDNLLNQTITFKHQLIALDQFLNQIEDQNEKKYIPFENIKSLIYAKESQVTKEVYFTINQIFTKMYRYFKNNQELVRMYQDIRFNTIIMTAGEKNV